MRISFILIVLSFILPSSALAKDDIGDYSIKNALNHPEAMEKLNSSISFYFGEQKHPKIERNVGTYSSNKKTNAFNKSDLQACDWVFLSALLSLQKRAIDSKANAVVNIRSNYKGNLTSSTTDYRCGAGKVLAGVALKGDIVVIKN